MTGRTLHIFVAPPDSTVDMITNSSSMIFTARRDSGALESIERLGLKSWFGEVKAVHQDGSSLLSFYYNDPCLLYNVVRKLSIQGNTKIPPEYLPPDSWLSKNQEYQRLIDALGDKDYPYVRWIESRGDLDGYDLTEEEKDLVMDCLFMIRKYEENYLDEMREICAKLDKSLFPLYHWWTEEDNELTNRESSDLASIAHLFLSSNRVG